MTNNYVALVTNDVIEAIFVAEYVWATENLSGDIRDLGPDPLTVGIGWTWDGEQWVAPPPREE